MNPYLFVYGTLRREHSDPFAIFLHENATLIGTAEMPGLKFDLGAYPGARYQEDCNELVSGEVYHMPDPEKVLAALDEYECIGSQYPEPHEFIRQECHIIYNGKSLRCWVYLYNWSFDK